MSQMETYATASSSFTHTGNLATTLNARATYFDDPWVIDLGASNHMTGMSSLFSEYNPYFGRDKVRIADVSLLPLSGKGFISVTLYMSLSFVLCVPDFVANLLSIGHINCELN